VPTQALYLLNNAEMASLAGAFADRLRTMADSDANRISTAYEICFARPATTEELERGAAYLGTIREKLGPGGGERTAWLSYCRALLVSNGFFYID
jgi:hypothetical protein